METGYTQANKKKEMASKMAKMIGNKTSSAGGMKYTFNGKTSGKGGGMATKTIGKTTGSGKGMKEKQADTKGKFDSHNIYSQKGMEC